MSKLEFYGIKGNIQRWISAFLTGRSQIVNVNNAESNRISVLSGIPQGSVLEPLLFIIYINDLPNNVDSAVYLFADDTKTMRQITTGDDSYALQKDIDSLELWSRKWLLDFNSAKCHVLTIGKFEDIRHTYRYKIYGHELEHVLEEKNLGVYIDSELKVEEHMSFKIKKANAMVVVFHSSTANCSKNCMYHLYNRT